MKKNFFKTIIIFSIFSIQLNSVVASDASQNAARNIPQGRILSDNIYNELKTKGFENLSRVPLSSAAFESFPYNIEIDFPTQRKFSQFMLDKDFIIAATQEDFFEYKDFFYALLDFAENSDFQFDLNFILTAGDKRKLFGNEKTLGSEVFCKTLEGAQNNYALVLNFNATKKTYITPGCSGEVAPLYFIKTLCTALDDNSIDYALIGGIYLSLYNLEILKSDVRLSSFLSRGVQAALLGILSTKNNYNAELNSIKEFLVQFEPSVNEEQSHHYTPIKIGNKRFWITEKQTVLALMTFTAFCLFIFSDFLFLFRKRKHRREKIKSRAIKSTYLIFLTAAILTASLVGGQIAAAALFKSGFRNIILLFILKISLPFFTVSLLYPIEIKFHKNPPPYVYEYILSISAFLNIFIFSLLDISLFFLFVAEFLILALSRIAKRTVLLYVFMAMFLLPFVPLLYSILIYADAYKITELVFCGIYDNIFLSCTLVPLSLLWLRVFARLNLKPHSKSNLAARYFISSIVSIAGIALITVASMYVVRELFFKNIELIQPFAEIENSPENIFAKVSIFETEYYGGKIRNIEIDSEKQAERYSVFVESQNSNPVYFSIYETDYQDGKTEFLLPENPPQKLRILYTPDSSENSIITIEAFFLKEGVSAQRHRPLYSRETFTFKIHDNEIMEQSHNK